MKQIALASVLAAIALSAVEVRAQDTLSSWDRYTGFLLSSCILDDLGLRSKMMAGMQAEYGAGMTERGDRDGMDFHDHLNGTTLELSASDEEVYCRVTIPAGVLDADGIEHLHADLDEQLGHKAPNGAIDRSEDETGTRWSFDGTKNNRITVMFSVREDRSLLIDSRSRIANQTWFSGKPADLG